MLPPLLIGVTCALAGPLGGGESLATLEAEQKALFEAVAPAVVVVSAGGTIAAGFAVAPGVVLTAAHAVAGRRDVQLTVRGGATVRGTVIEVAAGGLDVALVSVPPSDLPVLPLADASALRAGSAVASVGHPDGSRWTLAIGLVAQDPADAADARLMRLQLPLRAGSSGAPVVDRAGRVVGIVSLGDGETAATFAVRVEAALRALPRLARALGDERPRARAASSAADARS